MRSTRVIAKSRGVGLIVSEPADGQTLRELIAQGIRLDRGQLIDWGCQILDVLAEAHAAGRLHRHIGEDSVLVMPDGRIVLTGFGRAQPADEPLAVQSDLCAVGSLLRRLSFASRLKSAPAAGSTAGSGDRDPLFKVLARATFRDPVAGYRNATDMAEALRQAGRARAQRPISAPVLQLSSAPVKPFPTSVHPQAGVAEAGDRRWALLLLAVTLLLMLSVIVTGWLLLGGDVLPVSPDTVKTSIFGPQSAFKIP